MQQLFNSNSSNALTKSINRNQHDNTTTTATATFQRLDFVTTQQQTSNTTNLQPDSGLSPPPPFPLLAPPPLLAEPQLCIATTQHQGLIPHASKHTGIPLTHLLTPAPPPHTHPKPHVRHATALGNAPPPHTGRIERPTRRRCSATSARHTHHTVHGKHSQPAPARISGKDDPPQTCTMHRYRAYYDSIVTRIVSNLGPSSPTPQQLNTSHRKAAQPGRLQNCHICKSTPPTVIMTHKQDAARHEGDTVHTCSMPSAE